MDASRLKQARKSPPLLPSRLPSIGPHSAESSADEQSVRARVASISEALTGRDKKLKKAGWGKKNNPVYIPTDRYPELPLKHVVFGLLL